ncbi:putative endonuclease [Roseivirga ehrenbergii]|nr:putative endonuclease [Roseivirga ehrenbergii]
MPKLRRTCFDTMQSFGKKGEDLAVSFLKKKGYQVLHRNFRHKKSEIDIICSKAGLLVFVEVKSRSSKAFGQPESFVSKSQEQSILKASEAFVLNEDWHGDIRFDIIAIYKNGQIEEIEHFEDAFY